MTDRAHALLTWYRRHRRRLPWREEPKPYYVWVSELMLQQTQVKTVLPYFQRFVERFPDVESLARASEQDVLAQWSGLGYYRRAKALHRAARILVEERDGVFPEDVPGWMSLPGVGRYTAGAVVSIAFDKPAPILDGNVMRVLSRWFVVRGDPRAGEANRTLWRLAEDVLPERFVSEFNQALMELGAMVCTPRNPRCLVCPVRDHCGARQEGLETKLPEIPARQKSVKVKMTAAVIEEGGRLLMYRRDDSELMKGLWEFPGGECRDGEPPRAAVAREARERYGLSVKPGPELARVKHSIMNRRIDVHAFEVDLLSPPVEHTRAYTWVNRDELSELPVSSMVRKILDAM